MARLAGVDLPPKKRAEIGLTYIYGIGRTRSKSLLHRAGIEVILDVVYNHTAEGNHLGPTLSFRGVDNPTYYRLVADQPRYYMDYTGTGNSLNVRNPQVLKLIMDSLRYWIEEMHVDGFRFDLAATLARELHDVDRSDERLDCRHELYLVHGRE